MVTSGYVASCGVRRGAYNSFPLKSCVLPLFVSCLSILAEYSLNWICTALGVSPQFMAYFCWKDSYFLSKINNCAPAVPRLVRGLLSLGTQVMDVVSVQTYFSMDILAFFETLLQIRRPVLIGNELVDVSTAIIASLGGSQQSKLEQAHRVPPTNDSVPAFASRTASTPSRSEPEGTGNDVQGVPQRGQFDQLRVSHYFKGKNYGDLVRSLLLRGAMPIGLYRPAGTKGSTLPYTHVNPNTTEPLRAWPKRGERLWNQRSLNQGHVEGDSVFVLRSRSCRVFDYA